MGNISIVSIENSGLLENRLLFLCMCIFGRRNIEFRLVGGCIRDFLIKGKKVGDIDACTAMPAEEVMQLLQENGIKVIPTGIDYGTVTAVREDERIEITTLREDVECLGRHAITRCVDDWEVDAKRRDFTMNALYMKLSTEIDIGGRLSISRTALIYDYVGGISDINHKRLRFIGNPADRIKEDALRILRYFRLIAQLNLDEIVIGGIRRYKKQNNNDIDACEEYAHLVENLSGERIQHEMLKLLAADNPSNTLGLMADRGVFEHIGIGAIDNIKRYFPVSSYLDANSFTLVERNKNPILRLAMLVLCSKDKDIARIRQRWKLSNKDYKLLKLLIDNSSITEMSEETAKDIIYNYGNDVAEMIMIINNREEYIPLCQEWRAPTFPIAGRDLIKLGVKRGVEMGNRLKYLKNIWQKSSYKMTKEELLQKANTSTSNG